MRIILFVDDDLNLLNGLKRGLRSLRHDWDLHFVDSAEKALDFLTTHPVDILISDFRMPGMNGYQLMHQVQQRFPKIIRMILTGQPDRETYTESVSICHYFLWKPLEIEAFKPLLQRLRELHTILHDQHLTEILHGLNSLPTLPDTYRQLTGALNDPENDYQTISGLIRDDVTLTMQVLRMVNSAHIGLMRTLHSIDEAIQYLGLNTLRGMVIARQIFSLADADAESLAEWSQLWQHSFCSARLAEALVKNTEDQFVTAHSSFGGILHDVGKLVISHCLPEAWREIRELMNSRQLTQAAAEQEVLGVDHAAIGAYLASLWGLPHSVVEAIYLHHHQDISDYQGLSIITTAVWHANRICGGDLSRSKEQWQSLKKAPGLTGLLKYCAKETTRE